MSAIRTVNTRVMKLLRLVFAFAICFKFEPALEIVGIAHLLVGSHRGRAMMESGERLAHVGLALPRP